MCEIRGKYTESETYTGYKVLAKHKKTGKYYSSFTGKLYELGKVPLPPKKCKRLSTNWNYDLDNKVLNSLPFYNKEYEGKTSVFTDLTDLFYCIPNNYVPIYKDYYVVVVKVTIGGELFYSNYQDTLTFSGTEVIKIEEV